MARRTLAVIALITLPAVACDRAPTDPNLDVASLIAASGAVANGDLKPVTTTLPALFREAIAITQEQQGRVGVDALLGQWRDLQDDLTRIAPTSDRATVQARLDAIHAEELRIVLRVLGDPVVGRVIADASAGLATAETHLSTSAKPQDALQASAVVAQAREKMAGARAAAAANDLPRALDLGAQAVTLVSGLNFYLVELQRINGLEHLFPKAVAALQDGASNGKAQDLLAAAERSSIAARAALRDGDRQTAQKELDQARADQIDVVLTVLGAGVANQLVSQTARRSALLRDVIGSLDAGGRDVTRLKRMLNEATDLSRRAKLAFDKGDAATALDLGSHSAGMLNALQHLAWK
ncbi:MAG TPA: hypothetical protein VF021_08070 [Longimicrobiales bacterium]